jgi:hypothetical protein
MIRRRSGTRALETRQLNEGNAVVAAGLGLVCKSFKKNLTLRAQHRDMSQGAKPC